MTFLKKLGQVLVKGLAIVGGYGPVVKQLIPGTRDDAIIDRVQSDLVKAADIIAGIEAVGVALQLTGPQKLQAAIPQIGQVILKSDLLVGHKIKDQAKFQVAVQEYAQATVDLLNSLDDSGVETTDKT